jgi:hypothetical protein
MRALWCWGLLLTAVSLMASVTVTGQSDNHVTLYFDLSDVTLTPQGNYLVVNGSDLTHESTPNMTDLPWSVSRIGVPPNAIVTAHVVSSRTRVLELDHPLCPVPEIVAGTPTKNYVFTDHPTLPGPRPLIQTSDPERFRSLMVATVRVNPFEVNGRKLIIHDDMTVEVTISGGDRRAAGTEVDDFACGTVLNGETAGKWQVRTRDRVVRYADFSAYPVWASCEVSQDGMQKLTYTDLASVFNIGDVDPALLRVFSTGGAVQNPASTNPGLAFTEIPLYVSDGGDGQFDDGDYVLFYGRNRDGYGMNDMIDSEQYFNPYSQNTVYWITFGAGDTTPARISAIEPGTAQTTRSNHLEVIHYEQESVRRDTNGFDWFTASLPYVDNLTSDYEYHFTCTDAASGIDQFLRIGIQESEVGNEQHPNHMEAYVNGTKVIDAMWSGDSFKTYTDTLRTAVTGDNTLKIRIIRQSSTTLFFDYYHLSYPQTLHRASGQKLVNPWTQDAGKIVRWHFDSTYDAGLLAFEIPSFDSAIRRPVQSAGSGYEYSTSQHGAVYVLTAADAYAVNALQARNPVDLTGEAPEYDVLIVAPTEFMSKAADLSEIYHNDLNLDAKVADQQDILNQFSGGMPDPNAMRLCAKYLMDSGSPLRYLTLLGSGVSDWRNFSGAAGAKNRIMVFQRGIEASDDVFGYLHQANSPELGIGRYPAQTLAQLELQIAHMQNYLEGGHAGWWRNTMLFLADDNQKSATVDSIDHTGNIQTNAEVVSRACYVDKIFSIQYDVDEYHNKPQVRDLMIDKLNRGTLIWYYSGHGGPDIIGDERYFMISDLPSLNNLDCLPLFLAASCDVGEYDLWGVDCLAEQLTYQENGGVIGSIAATRASEPTANTRLMSAFFIHLLNERETVGRALMDAKADEDTGNSELYNLLGDPTLPINPPSRLENITLDGDTFPTLKTISAHGNYQLGETDGVVEVRVLDSEKTTTITANHVFTFTNSGNLILRGTATMTDGRFDADFVIPYDITQGSTARVLSYYCNPVDHTDAVCYKQDLPFLGHDYLAENPDAPSIRIWMDSRGFVDGDPVGASPILIVEAADSNGVNILGTPGHRILARLDDSNELTDITESFFYNCDSHTTGELQYQLEGLAKGAHTVQVIVVDNLNTPAIATANFRVTGEAGESAVASIQDPLPCPSPWDGKGRFNFTFFLTEDANVSISIHTMTGKKIRTIKAPGLSKGFQSVAWDGRDAEGDKLANNTYFYVIRAKTVGAKGGDEAKGTFVIYK